MCGACGSGGGLPRWEDRLQPATRRVLAARAAAANRLLAGSRLRVRAWGSHYLVSDGRGRSTPAADLDTLWRTCGHWGFEVREGGPGWGEGPEAETERTDRERGAGCAVPLETWLVDDLAPVAVGLAAVAACGQGSASVRLCLPDGLRDRTLVVEVVGSVVTVRTEPLRQLSPVLSGEAAWSAVRVLRAASPGAVSVAT